jgi:hypothetical protein
MNGVEINQQETISGSLFLSLTFIYLFFSLSFAGRTIKTVGGTGKGANCIIPFIANGKCHDKCVKYDGEKHAWCSTSGNYDLDNEMGYCINGKLP